MYFDIILNDDDVKIYNSMEEAMVTLNINFMSAQNIFLKNCGIFTLATTCPYGTIICTLCSLYAVYRCGVTDINIIKTTETVMTIFSMMK